VQTPRSATSSPYSMISKPLIGAAKAVPRFSPNKKLIRNVKIHLINPAGCRSIEATSKNR
jgi:hypothetical protein